MSHDVPDLAYGDAPDAFDSPDGRTYSGPVSAATPGRAERERFAAKMEMLADWFDADDFAKGRAGRTEVQEDLRRWAAAARNLAAQDAPGDGLLDPLHALAAKWDATAARNQRNGQSLIDQGDEYGNEGLAVAEALGACVVDLRAVLADAPEAKPAPELAAEGMPPDVRPRSDGRRGLDITCRKCGEDYGTNVDVDEIECPECEARRCPHCLTWYGGNS